MKIAFHLRKYHKWLALIVGLQAIIWSLSGLYMTAVNIENIHGDHLIKVQDEVMLSDIKILPLSVEYLTTLNEIKSVKLTTINTIPHYQIKTADNNIQLNATTLESINELDAAQIRTIANKVYAGDNEISNIELLNRYPSELGGRKQPLWKVEYNDWLNSTLYFLPDTGALRGKRSDLWRWFDFLWMLHIMDYDTREDVNNNLLRVAASLGVLMSLAGLGLLFFSFRKSVPQQSSNSLLLVKKLHKWISLLIGLQLFLWMLSGLMFSLLNHKEVKGSYLLNKSISSDWSAKHNDFANLVIQYPQATVIDSYFLLARPVYRIKSVDETLIVDAATLHKIEITESVTKSIAERGYAGDGEIRDIQKQELKTLENRKLSLPLWQVNFADEENSSLYLSASTGQIYEIKTDTWRWFDFFWMLHIMDYSERSDMNNALVIFIGLLTSFIALTGIWLLCLVFSAKDFNFMAKFKRVPLLISGGSEAKVEIFAPKNSRLYEVLANQGYQLASTCGGGGSCGLCQVKVDSSTPISASDKALLSRSQINAGYRLACQLSLTKGLKVNLPEQVFQQQLLSCQVISNQFKTPFIKELILQVPAAENFIFNAGEYILIHIPVGVAKLEQVELADDVAPYWLQDNIKQFSSKRTEAITRTYSMANPPVQNKQIVLNVRLALPIDGIGESGKGSSYLFSLSPNDLVKISGPFGHFHAMKNNNEMIFIGGGAGMAPLRSHILHQLKTLHNENKISFWFGARNQSEIFYEAEFNQLEKDFANFNWHVALSDSESLIQQNNETNWTGYVGVIHQVLNDNYLSKLTDLKNIDFYICGPPLMNQAVLSLLYSLGVSENNIHLDDFGC